MRSRSRDFLIDRLENYPFLAEIPTGIIRPHEYPSEVAQCSAVLEMGLRIWAFALRTDRDEFVRSYPQARKLEELSE